MSKWGKSWGKSWGTAWGSIIVTSGGIFVWLGTWVKKPIKYWNGTNWVQKPIKRWNGSFWTLIP